MKYIFISFLMLITLQLTHYIEAAITDENIRQISEVYHSAIRAYTGLSTLSNDDIDSALQIILQRQPATPSPTISSGCQHMMVCQPRTHLISDREVRNRLIEESSRVSSIRGYFLISTRNPESGDQPTPSAGLTLHRCSDDASACSSEHHKCSVNVSKVVNIDVTIFHQGRSFVETLDFVNHTECTCQRASSVRCLCPEPFTNVTSESSAEPCQCECITGREEECQQIRSGTSSVSWSESRLPAYFDVLRHYEICRRDSTSGEWRCPAYSSTMTYCPRIECGDGLTFDVMSLRCREHTPSPVIHTSTTQFSAVATEYRTMRDIKRSDYLELPASTEQTTPLSLETSTIPFNLTSTVARKKLSKKKIRRKLERKMAYVKKNGLINARSTSKIGEDIYDEFQRLHGTESNHTAADRQPGDIVLNVYKKSAQITCKVIVKSTYFVLPLPSHVLFCSLDVH